MTVDVVVADADKAKKAYETLTRSSARFVLAEYYEALLAERQRGFTLCTKETFDTHKGRCLELQELAKKLRD